MSAPFARGTMTPILGIEDTCVYPPHDLDMQSLDEHVLTGHDRAWRADLDEVAALGAGALRYGVDWPRVETAPGEYDWAVIDERMRYAASLGLTVIADLVHYGTPTWLDASFADSRYPAVVAAFAGAFAARYAGVVDHITPLNEPITTASFAGLRGVWPPALTGWEGWTRVVLGIARGIQRSVAAVRTANRDAVIVHVEASSLYETVGSSEALVEEAALLTAVGTLPTDLVLGRVDAAHPSRAWLVAHGADAAALDELVAGGIRVDLLGVNYYPDLSPRALVATRDGIEQRAVNRWTEGLRASLAAFEARYGLPMLVTETSIEGPDELRTSWVRDSAAAVLELAAGGMDVRGWTWWPVFDFVDWSYASGGRNVEEFALPDEIVAARRASLAKEPYLRRMGLIRLDEHDDGELGRVRTRAADAFAETARTMGESTR